MFTGFADAVVVAVGGCAVAAGGFIEANKFRAPCGMTLGIVSIGACGVGGDSKRLKLRSTGNWCWLALRGGGSHSLQTLLESTFRRSRSS